MLGLVPTDNPIFPPEYDYVWNLLMWLVVGLLVLALVDLVRSEEKHFVRGMGWAAIIIGLPIIGPALWFMYGRLTFQSRRP